MGNLIRAQNIFEAQKIFNREQHQHHHVQEHNHNDHHHHHHLPHPNHHHHHLPHHKHEHKREHERKVHNHDDKRTPIDDVSKEETTKLTANIALAESGPAILEPSLDSTTTSNNRVVAREQRD